MDPLTLGLLAGAAGLLIGSSFRPSADRPGPFRWRKILTWTDGWVATELVSVAALRTAVDALDLPRDPSWEAALSVRLRTFVLVTRDGAPSEWAVLCSFDRIGSEWEPREVFGYGMNRTLRPEQEQHVSEVIDYMRRDLGREIADRAMAIPDPVRRYAFLRAVVRQPVLAARVVPEADFADVVMQTAAIVAPERLEAIAERDQLEQFEPVTADLVVRRLPYSTQHLLPAP